MKKLNRLQKICLAIVLPALILINFGKEPNLASAAKTVTVSASLFESLLKKIDSLVSEVSSLKKTVADFISRENKQVPSSSSGSTENNTQTSPTDNSDQTSNPSTDSGSAKNALDNLTDSYGGQTQNNSGKSNNNSSNPDNSNQNTNKSLTSEIGDWFKKVLGLDKQKSQPSTPQKQEQQRPAQQQQQPSQQQQQQGQQKSGQENGTGKLPFKLEPNQFKKICGQNTYVLYYRIGGIGKRDMLRPTAKEGTGAGGAEDTGDYVFEIPSCSELAKCHCCCNTCQIPESLCQQPGWVFAKKGCVAGCSNKCEANCKKGCKDWKKPTPPPGAPFDRDCDCQMEGCPDGKDCMILIKDMGESKLEYTSKLTGKEVYNPGAGFAYFMNGNGPDTDQSKIKSSSGNDTNKHGWIKRLKEEPGICCGCTQDAPL